MTNPTPNREDVLKRLSGRNWLHNAAIVLTSAFVLFLAGCTKEQWYMVKNPKPGGGLGSSPEQWYKLRATYLNQDNPSPQKNDYQLNGYLGPTKTIDYPNYVEIGGDYPDRYKLQPAGDGWVYLETTEGYWLSITRSGWLYNNSDSTRKVAWKIVDGKLYNLYWNKDNWTEYPAGARMDLADFYPPYVEWNYFASVGLDEKYTLTNCELVPAP
jgi:hypothetical protein